MTFSLSVAAVRASIVFDEIAGHSELVETIDDIAHLPRLAGWTDEIRNTAVADLVADGLLEETSTGRLMLKPREPA